MIIDKKGKLFGKVSIIDIFVIIIVIVSIFGISQAMSRIDNDKLMKEDLKTVIDKSSQSDELEIKLTAKGVRDITRDAIIVGDKVYYENEVLGVVSYVESEPSMQTVESTDGTVYSAITPDRYDVTIVVETTGRKMDNGYYTDSNIHLLYGKKMEVKTSTILTTPEITEINVLNEAKSVEEDVD